MTKNKSIRQLAYHGSRVSISDFDYAFTEAGVDQLGSGFYFTTDRAEAMGYAVSRVDRKIKIDDPEDLTVHLANITLGNPIMHDQPHHFKRSEIQALVLGSPILDDCLANWGDIEFDGRKKLIVDAINSYDFGEPVHLIKTLNMLSNDFYGGHVEAFFTQVNKVLGFDGVCAQYDNKTHLVAWFPNQIDIIARESVLEEICASSINQDQELSPHMYIFQPVSKDFSSDLLKLGLSAYSTFIAAQAHMTSEHAQVIVYQLKDSGHIYDLNKSNDIAILKDRGFRSDSFDGYDAEQLKARGVDGIYRKSERRITIHNPLILKFMGVMPVRNQPSMRL